MKNKFSFVIGFLFLAQVAAASTEEIQACRPEQMRSMRESIADKKKDGLSNVKLMMNSDQAVIGYYAWEKSGEESMYAEICEYIGDPDLTIASEWYYWDGDADPSSFKKNRTYEMTQDEGIAQLKIIKSSKRGDITAELSVIGWNEEKLVVARRSVVSFADSEFE